MFHKQLALSPFVKTKGDFFTGSAVINIHNRHTAYF